MFKACYDISGAINYDTDKIDATYANPETGYFRHDPTNFTAYAVLTDNQLTFYFDSKRDERAAEATTKKVFDIVRTDDLPQRPTHQQAGTRHLHQRSQESRRQVNSMLTVKLKGNLNQWKRKYI